MQLATEVTGSLPARLPKGFVLDEYVVDGWVRNGGMAAIYRGHRAEGGLRVAIKIQLPPTVRDPQICAHFDLEADAMWRVAGTPQVAELFEAGVLADGRRYFVLEWVEGEDLEELIDLFRNREQRLGISRVCRIGEQIALGLAALHDNDLVHRDLKPANVMVSPGPAGTEIVKLLDFGIVADLRAKASGEPVVAERAVMGTSAYMPPEQAAGGAPTPALDLYALGVLLFEALSGNCVPPDGWSPETLRRVDTLRRGIPKALADLVHGCIRSDPRRRPKAAAVVAKQIGEIAAQLESAVVVSRARQESPSRTGETDIVVRPGAEAKAKDRATMRARSVSPGGTEISLTHQQVLVQSGMQVPLYVPLPPSADGYEEGESRRAWRRWWILVPLVVVLLVGAWLSWPEEAPRDVDDGVAQRAAVEVMPVEELPDIAMPEEPVDAMVVESESDGEEREVVSPQVEREPEREPEPEPEVREPSPPVRVPSPATEARPREPDEVDRPKKPSEQECVAMRIRAAAKKRERSWSGVLEATKIRACWAAPEQRIERKRLRVTAFAETGRYLRCAQEGGNSRDRDVLPRVEYCNKRMGR